jgi:hypothetical protein
MQYAVFFGEHLLLMDFGPYEIIFLMGVFVTYSMVMQLKNFGFIGYYYNRCYGNAVKGGPLYTRTCIQSSTFIIILI